MPNVLVTDGEQRASLAVVRSLGRAGYAVDVCSSRASSLAGSSRYTRNHAALPSALSEPDAFISRLETLVREWDIDVLLPMTEPALLAVLPERERFGNARIPFASYEHFLRISDKAVVAEVAKSVGIRVPAQVLLASRQDAVGLDDRLDFPIVLKPSRSVVGEGAERLKVSVVHVDRPALLEDALAALPDAVFPVMAQERIVGPGIGIFLLMREGEPRAAFAHRRIREKPPSGGVSVYRESAAMDPQLLERSCELLRRLEWEGVAMVEFKMNEETGVPYIMEINGRFWGSLQLAIDSGVDFPKLLLDENDEPAVKDYQIGVRSRWEWGDVDHLLLRLRRSAEELALPAGSPGRGATVLDFLRACGPGSRNEVLRASDPRPFFRESLDWFQGR